MTWPQLIRRTILGVALAMLGITVVVPSPARGDGACGAKGDIICSSSCARFCRDSEGKLYCCSWSVKVKEEEPVEPELE